MSKIVEFRPGLRVNVGTQTVGGGYFRSLHCRKSRQIFQDIPGSVDDL